MYFIGIKERTRFCEKERNYRRSKICGEIWSPGEIWFLALYTYFIYIYITYDIVTRSEVRFPKVNTN